MVAALSFTGIALHQDDVDMETQPIRIKIFGCDSDEEVERDEYFESFFRHAIVSFIAGAAVASNLQPFRATRRGEHRR
jgi:hypothetical protein